MNPRENIRALCDTINVAPKYFKQIRDRKKTVEGRLAKEKFSAMQVGDLLEFVSGGDRILTKILEIKKFPTFKEMLEYYGVNQCLPGIDNLDEAVSIYHAFPGYRDAEVLLGVLGIKVALVNVTLTCTESSGPIATKNIEK
ncbi:ASCH domain-containing protein [Rickettsiella endosymbiont of Dermanyssus gallinae]|uniref:ASCH domain-containing protein n=1 Tax=Rickettsiella endosymbiont of Dermanyssus gallinae TaxID=2856608 RepID=UPI001C527C50|nr:ASCH domain-containing protein [Rickettsiella endosymbiont of Dermanyssus gallinae]